MNIYSYFQRVERNIQGVPSKHTGLYNETINQTKLANLSKTSSYEIIILASDLLQDDNNEFTGFKEEMKKRVNEKKEHFWFREFLDFPLYLFIYITCLNVLYDMIGNGFQSFMVLITPGFLIQMYHIFHLRVADTAYHKSASGSFLFCCVQNHPRKAEGNLFSWYLLKKARPISMLYLSSNGLPVFVIIMRKRIADFPLVFGNAFFHGKSFVDVKIHILSMTIAYHTAALSLYQKIHCHCPHGRSIYPVFTGRASPSLHVAQDRSTGLDPGSCLDPFRHSFRMADTFRIDDNVVFLS